MTEPNDPLLGVLTRIATTLERIAGRPAAAPDWSQSWAFVADRDGFRPVKTVHAPPLSLLQGVDSQATALACNTDRFARGAVANNALLWGARGTGKSALVKAVCREAAATHPDLKLIQLDAETLTHAHDLVSVLRRAPGRFVLFIDDLSLDPNSALVSALKPALDGGLDAGDGRMIVYATSNRRHVMSRNPAENTDDDLFWKDTAEERLAVSDRFGLSLGFHSWSQPTYLAAVHAYAERYGLPTATLDKDAIAWATARGARSGRTAWQYIVHLAGQCGVAVER